MRRWILVGLLALVAPVMFVGAEGPAQAAKGDGDHIGVTEIAPNTFRIKQEVFDRYAHDLHKAGTLASASPHHGANGVTGWDLTSIPKHGLAHAAGLHNGDRVTKVNGKDLKGMPGVALTLQSLKNDKNYTVKVTRRDGRKVTLKYQVR